MNILQQIFIDHYEQIMILLKPRAAVVENIDRMIHCGDPDYGCAIYECKSCGNVKFIPFHCLSRFCPTCGNFYAIQRSASVSLKLVRCRHRHLVFTISQEIRHFFLENRDLLNLLFQSVKEVIFEMFHKINRWEQFTLGFICVLHTFGRSLQWNPHIHVLITEGAAGNNEIWRKVKFFPYLFLRESFRTVLLRKMKEHLGDSFKPEVSASYKNQEKGFYVYAKPSDAFPLQTMKYISRYLGRPVIATSRIDHYDGESVTFHYNRHEDNEYVEETLPVLDFIKRLIIHIPEKHFKMIRYYGIYAKHHKQEPELRKVVKPELRQLFLSWYKWRAFMLTCFQVDPIQCHVCGKTMTLMQIRFNKQKETLAEHYWKIMHKPPD